MIICGFTNKISTTPETHLKKLKQRYFNALSYFQTHLKSAGEVFFFTIHVLIFNIHAIVQLS